MIPIKLSPLSWGAKLFFFFWNNVCGPRYLSRAHFPFLLGENIVIRIYVLCRIEQILKIDIWNYPLIVIPGP